MRLVVIAAKRPGNKCALSLVELTNLPSILTFLEIFASELGYLSPNTQTDRQFVYFSAGPPINMHTEPRTNQSINQYLFIKA